MDKGPDHPMSTVEKLWVVLGGLLVLGFFLALVRFAILEERIRRIEAWIEYRSEAP